MPRKKRSSEEGNYNPKSAHEANHEDLDHLGKNDFSGMEFENEEFGAKNPEVNPEESDIIEAREESKKKHKRSL